MGVEKEIFKELMHFHYMTYMAKPKQKSPCPGSHEMYKFGRPFLIQHYYTLSLYGPRTGAEKILYEIHQFYTFYPKLPSLGVGVMKFTKLLSPYPTDESYHI